jgi:heat shock protein HslJ
MKKIFCMGCAICLILGISACKPKEQANNAGSNVSQSEDNRLKNSSDWEGTYTGLLPCAECEGIQVQITLLSGNTYKMCYQYQGKEPLEETYEGTFQSEGDLIILGNLDKSAFPVYYKIGENRITQLDTKGDEITSELAENYVLVKLDTNLTDKHWKLTEIKGNPVTEKDGTKPAYITFSSKDARVSGNSGCNSFSGTYRLKYGNKLVFSSMVSTRAMCSDMNIENKLNEVFRTVDTYTINGNILSLNGTATTPLARFIAE